MHETFHYLIRKDDNFIKFRINGIDRKCYMLKISTKSFEKPGDFFTTCYKTILIPINKEKMIKIIILSKNLIIIGIYLERIQDT